MSESMHTTLLKGWIDRIKSGDQSAWSELLTGAGRRMELLARKMLKESKSVRRWADTDDVLQNTAVRLMRALPRNEFSSLREFFAFSATLMRRELIDLARGLYGPQGIGRNHNSGFHAEEGDVAGVEPAAHSDDVVEIESWCKFHEEVEALPTEEREVVSLAYYHGWTQAQIADLFQVNVRTIKRRWYAALSKLHNSLGNWTVE